MAFVSTCYLPTDPFLPATLMPDFGEQASTPTFGLPRTTDEQLGASHAPTLLALLALLAAVALLLAPEQ